MTLIHSRDRPNWANHAGRTGRNARMNRRNARMKVTGEALLPIALWFAGSRRRGTIVTMTTDSLRNVKDRFSEFVDRVDREHERVIVTRNGRPAAVLISPDDLDSLEETLALMSDRTAIRELVEAEEAVRAGDVVRGVDAVRALLKPPVP